MIELIMDSQEDDEVKKAKADLVIYNNGTMEDLETAVEKALSSYGLAV